jgi:hypothetical protein
LHIRIDWKRERIHAGEQLEVKEKIFVGAITKVRKKRKKKVRKKKKKKKREISNNNNKNKQQKKKRYLLSEIALLAITSP